MHYRFSLESRTSNKFCCVSSAEQATCTRPCETKSDSNLNMGAILCIENSTDRTIVVHLEQISVRYWALIEPRKKIIWEPDQFHLDLGIYTLRAIDVVASPDYQPPSYAAESFKLITGSVLIASAGVGVILCGALLATPAAPAIVGGIGAGATAVACGVGAAASGGVFSKAKYKTESVTKPFALVGRGSKYRVSLTTNRKLQWEKVVYNRDERFDCVGVIFPEKGERCVLTKDSLTAIRKAAVVSAPPRPPVIRRAVTKREKTSTLPKSRGSKVHTSTLPSHCRSCKYFKMCERFFTTLDIPENLREKQYDKCFCRGCSSSRGEKRLGCKGKPPQHFTVPWGFAKIGVKVTPQAEHEEIFDNWHVCFHGTESENICNILKLGRLIKPGDILPNGKALREKEGHFNEMYGPLGFNSKQYFFSPVAAYSSSEVYGRKTRYRDRVTSTNHLATTLLQVKLQPNTYTTGKSTIREEIYSDPVFDDKVEWMTRREGVHHIYGVLVMLKQQHN